MKFFTSSGIVLLGSCLLSSGFPTADNVARLARSGGLELPEGFAYEEVVRHVQRHKQKRLLLNPLTTPIDVSGSHAWREPDFTAGAQRGPCPGLNALANHGYIDRSGVASVSRAPVEVELRLQNITIDKVAMQFLDVIPTINEVYGMEVGLATILSVMGTVWTGDPLSLTPGFSLDGSSPKVVNLLGNLLGLLGEPRGIGRSHNWLEADASLTRDDLYVTGNASTMNMDRFLALYHRPGDDTDVISMDDIVQYSISAIDESIATNPYFWYGPFTGLIFRNAGVAFAARLLSNHSAENPGGMMTKEVFKSFWGVVDGDNGQLEYKRGWERIPENWYKIPVDYSLVNLNVDIVSWVLKYPVLASVGGNTGTVNSFTGIDISDISGGLLNAATLLEGNNLLCYALQVVKTFSPDSLSPLFATLAVPLGLLTDALGTALTDLSCAPFEDLQYKGKPLWEGLIDAFAGAAKAGSAL